MSKLAAGLNYTCDRIIKAIIEDNLKRFLSEDFYNEIEQEISYDIINHSELSKLLHENIIKFRGAGYGRR